MYKHILKRELTLLPDTIKARVPKRVPSVLSHNEAMSIINQLSGSYKMMFSLLYSFGIRKTELLMLRVKDIDFESRNVYIFRGKGGKDLVTMLPEKLIEPLKSHIEKVRDLHEKDLCEGEGKTILQLGLARKYP